MSQAFPAVGALNQGLQLTQAIFGGIKRVSGEVYGSLIAQNEQLNQQIIKQAAIIATNTRQLDEFGNEIADTQTELLNLQGPLREAILQLQIETRELAGVTTQQVNESFTAVLQNYNRLIGQTKRNNGDVLQSSIELTKGVVAAIGTIGLPLQQVQQEIRAILQGDLNNPDALLAKTLNISREQFNEARAQGEVIDLLIDKLDAFVVANQLASRSVGNISVNIQDFFEQVARAAGEPLLDPIVDNLAKFQDFLFSIQDRAEATGAVVGGDFADLLEQLGNLLQSLITLFQPIINFLGNTLISAVRLATKTLTGLVAVTNGAVNVFQFLVNSFLKAREAIFKFLGPFKVLLQIIDPISQLGFAADGLEALANIGDESNNSFDDLVENIRNSNEELEESGKQVRAIQEEIANIKGNDSLTEEEQNQLIEEQKKELVEVLKNRREIENSIKRAELAIKSKNVEGDKEIAQQKEALKLARELAGERADINIQANELPSLGTIAEEVEGKITNLREKLETEFDLTELGKATTELQKLTTLAFEQGLQDLETTLEDFESIISDVRLTGEQRIAALGAIDKLFKIQLQDAKSLLDIEKERLNIDLQSGDIGNTELKIGLEELKIKEAELKLEQAQEKLRLANIAGTERSIENAEREVESLETQIESLEGKIADIEFKALQSDFKRNLDGIQLLIEGFALDRSREIRDFSDQNAETIARIQQINSNANQLNIDDRLQLNAIAREQLEIELENASTQEDIRTIQEKLTKNVLEGGKLELELREEIAKQAQNELAIFDELFQNTQNFNQLNRAENALLRQERLGVLIQEEESIANRISATNEDIRLQRQRLDFLNSLIDSQDTSQEDRINFLKESEKLETDIANKALENIRAEIQLENQLRSIRESAFDLAEKNLSNTSNRISQLLNAQADLQNSISGLQEGRSNRELERINRAIEIAKELESEDLSDEDRSKLEFEQARLGVSSDIASLEKKRIEIQETALEREQEALFRKIELSETLLKIENERAEIAAKIAAIEAEQRAVEAQSKLLDLVNQSSQAQERGDQEAVDLINAQIQAQQELVNLSRQGAKFAREAIDLTEVTNQIRELSQLSDNINQVESLQQRADLQSARDERFNPNLQESPLGAELPDTTALTNSLKETLREQSMVQQEQSSLLDQMLGELRKLNLNRIGGGFGDQQNNTTINNVNTTPPDIGAIFGLIGAT